MSLCISLKLRGEASIDTSNQEKSLGGTCSLPGTAFISALTAVVWGGKHLPSAGGWYLLLSALEVESHRRKAATWIWAEDKPDKPTYFWNRDVFTGGLRERREECCRFAGPGPPEVLQGCSCYPLFGWWCPCLTALSAAWLWLSFANLFVMVVLLSLSSQFTRKKISISFYIVWVKDVLGPVTAWHKKVGKLDSAWLPFTTDEEITAKCPAQPLSSLSLLSVTWSFWSSDTVCPGHWYWIPLFFFSDSFLVTAKNLPNSYTARLDPASSARYTNPFPLCERILFPYCFRKLTPQQNKTKINPLWSLSH